MMLIEVLPATMSLVLPPILLVLLLLAVAEWLARTNEVWEVSTVFLLGACTMYILQPVLYYLLGVV